MVHVVPTAESEGEVLGESVSVWGRHLLMRRHVQKQLKAETERDVYFPTLACEPLELMFTFRLVLSWPLSVGSSSSHKAC